MAARNGLVPTASETTRQNEKLKNEIASLKAERESLKLTVSELDDEMCKLRNDTKKDIKLLRSEIKELKAESKEEEEMLQRKTEQLEKRIKSLQSEIKELKAIIKSFEERRGSDLLYLSQLAFLFEQTVCSYVLPDVFKKDNFATIKSLLDILNGGVRHDNIDKNKEAKILRDGRRRWEEVCDNLHFPEEWKTKSEKWKINDCRVPPIIRAIGYLKKCRVAVAHPSPIKLSEAKEMVLSDSIKEKFTDSQYELIKDFICSMRENLEKGNLHHDEIDVS